MLLMLNYASNGKQFGEPAQISERFYLRHADIVCTDFARKLKNAVRLSSPYDKLLKIAPGLHEFLQVFNSRQPAHAPLQRNVFEGNQN